jgi:hypothetical protein
VSWPFGGVADERITGAEAVAGRVGRRGSEIGAVIASWSENSAGLGTLSPA